MKKKIRKHSDISERISQVIDSLKITKNEFSRKLGYKRSQSIYDIANGKCRPSFDFFNKFYLSEYSERFNHYWLMTGNGVRANTLGKELRLAASLPASTKDGKSVTKRIALRQINEL